MAQRSDPARETEHGRGEMNDHMQGPVVWRRDDFNRANSNDGIFLGVAAVLNLYGEGS